MNKRRKGEAALPAPEVTRAYPLTDFRGLDRRSGVWPGYFTRAQGLDPRALPALQGMPSFEVLDHVPSGNMQALYVLDGGLYVFYKAPNTSRLRLYRRQPWGETNASLQLSDEDAGLLRTLLPYNRYVTPQAPLFSGVTRKALILPDGLWFTPAATVPSLLPEGEAQPRMLHGCICHSRLFGARGDRLFASAYNDPCCFDLDTATDIGPGNAWASVVQSEETEQGDFTALCVYDGHVLAFKKQACYIVNNNKNPFRVAKLMDVGTADARTPAVLDGCLFFVAQDGVWRWNGAEARRISDPLAATDYTGARAAAHDGIYYLYLPAHECLYLYAERTGAWCSMALPGNAPLADLASGGGVLYLLGADGTLYRSGTQRAPFSLTTWPLSEPEPMRACRFSLALTAAAAATVQADYTDTRGRQTPLLDTHCTAGHGQVVSRVFTPADHGGCLSLAASGSVTVQELRLTVREG